MLIPGVQNMERVHSAQWRAERIRLLLALVERGGILTVKSHVRNIEECVQQAGWLAGELRAVLDERQVQSAVEGGK